MDPTCGSGVKWYRVPGYNNGLPFEAYTDTSVDGVNLLVFHHVLYHGPAASTHPTIELQAEGAPGLRQSHRLTEAGSLLSAMCPPSSSARFYVGQHDEAPSGTDFASSSNLNWIAWTDKTGSEFVQMFDHEPELHEFTGEHSMRRGDGTSDGGYSCTSSNWPTDVTCNVVQCNQVRVWPRHSSSLLFPYWSDVLFCAVRCVPTAWECQEQPSSLRIPGAMPSGNRPQLVSVESGRWKHLSGRQARVVLTLWLDRSRRLRGAAVCRASSIGAGGDEFGHIIAALIALQNQRTSSAGV